MRRGLEPPTLNGGPRARDGSGSAPALGLLGCASLFPVLRSRDSGEGSGGLGLAGVVPGREDDPVLPCGWGRDEDVEAVGYLLAVDLPRARLGANSAPVRGCG